MAARKHAKEWEVHCSTWRFQVRHIFLVSNSRIPRILLDVVPVILPVIKLCTPAIYAECGRFPIIITQTFQVIKYWQRILKLKDNHILKHAYNSQLQLYRLGHENWCTCVK